MERHRYKYRNTNGSSKAQMTLVRVLRISLDLSRHRTPSRPRAARHALARGLEGGIFDGFAATYGAFPGPFCDWSQRFAPGAMFYRHSFRCVSSDIRPSTSAGHPGGAHVVGACLRGRPRARDLRQRSLSRKINATHVSLRWTYDTSQRAHSICFGEK